MAGLPVQIELPPDLYRQIKEAADRAKRPVDEVLTEAVAAVAPVVDSAPGPLKSALAHLAYLNDAALWQAGRAAMAPEQRDRLEALHELKRRRPLQDEEAAEEEALVSLYRETLLIRAQAAVLLKQRGYDISDP